MPPRRENPARSAPRGLFAAPAGAAAKPEKPTAAPGAPTAADPANGGKPAPRRGAARPPTLTRQVRIARTAAHRRAAAKARSLMAQPGQWAPWFAVAAVVVAAAASGARGYETLSAQRDRIRTLSTEIAGLEAEAATLQARIASLENDPAALELLARGEHQMALPGEIVALLEFPEPPAPAEGAEEGVSPPTR